MAEENEHAERWLDEHDMNANMQKCTAKNTFSFATYKRQFCYFLVY